MYRWQILSGALATAGLSLSGAASAQTARPRRVGFLMGCAEGDRRIQAGVDAFREGLRAVGLAEGRDIPIDYRWARAFRRFQFWPKDRWNAG